MKTLPSLSSYFLLIRFFDKAVYLNFPKIFFLLHLMVGGAGGEGAGGEGAGGEGADAGAEGAPPHVQVTG